MKAHRFISLIFALAVSLAGGFARSQDLGPHFKKLKEGIFVYAQNPADSNATIIVTTEGVVLIDSGHRPPDTVALAHAVKKLTSQPVRYLINTKPHTDHTTGHWLFSPPALIVAHAGATDAMKQGLNPERVRKIVAEYPNLQEMKNFRPIWPHIEFRDKMALQVGD
jgi:cyclase